MIDLGLINLATPWFYNTKSLDMLYLFEKKLEN